jgi:hypothetical protein
MHYVNPSVYVLFKVDTILLHAMFNNFHVALV